MSVLLAMTLALAIPQGDLSRKVSFESVAKPVRRMLPELSKAVGVNLMSTGVTQDDVLVIRVEDAPLSELMKRIADVTNAEWKAEGDGYRLVRPEILAREERRAEYAAKLAQTEELLKKHRDRLAKREAFDAEGVARRVQALRTNRPGSSGEALEWRTIERLGESVPLGRALHDAVATLTPQDLAAIEPFTRVVFSSRPTRMQRAMPTAMRQVLERYQAEQARFAEAAERILTQQDGFTIYGGMALHLNKPFDPTGKVLLVVIPMDAAAYRMSIKVLNPSGQTLGESSLYLTPYSEEMANPKGPPTVEPSEEFPISEITADLMRTMKEARARPGSRPQLSPSALAYLSRPDLNDPLSLMASDMMLGWAKVTSRNIVANLPDSAMNSLGFGAMDVKVGLPILKMWLQYDRSIQARESERWIEVEPTTPTVVRQQRADRPALARLVQAAIRKGRLDLDDRAQYAITIKGRGYSMMGESYVQLLTERAGPGAAMEGSQEMLRFYGFTSPVLRNRLASGQPVPLSALSPQQVVELERMVFDAEYAQLTQELPHVPGEYSDGRPEPTEALPNGLPRDGTLRFESRGGEVALPKAKEGNQRTYWEPMTADSLAMQLSMAERSDLYPWMLEQQMPKTFHFGTQLTLVYHFEFAPGIRMQQQLVDRNLDTSRLLTLEELPAKFRGEVNDKLVEMRKMNERRGGG